MHGRVPATVSTPKILPHQLVPTVTKQKWGLL